MDIAEVQAAIAYDPETGRFTRLVYSGGRQPGSAAGTTKTQNGYVYISVNRRRVLGHRAAFALMTGQWPNGPLDHINGVRDDNRWVNLRPATISQNSGNTRRHRDNACGRKGVYLHKQSGLYHATIMVDGSKHSLGYFRCCDDASAAYSAAASKHFGEFARAE